MTEGPGSIDAVEALLEGQGYVAARSLATVVFLSLRLGKPLFLEGYNGFFQMLSGKRRHLRFLSMIG